MDGDSSEPAGLTWAEREAMIRAAHRRLVARQRRLAATVAFMDATRGGAGDAADEMAEFFRGWAE